MWDKSEVMSEFLKIASEQNMIKEAYPEQNPYAEDKKTIEEKTLPKSEKHIMEIAHPEPVYVAEARGDGGLVENEIENQQKVIEMINKMPEGSLVGRYAKTAIELIKMANACDDVGETVAGDALTNAAKTLFTMAGIMEGPDYGHTKEEEKQRKWEEEHPEEVEEERKKEEEKEKDELKEGREMGWSRW